MSATKNAAKVAKTRRVSKWMRKRNWHYGVPRNGVRARLYALSVDHHPWWDWGHRVMVMFGVDNSGNWSEPQPPTWWYRLGREAGPPHVGRREDQMYEWKAIGVNCDGELHLGHQYWGKTFYGLTHYESALLGRYLRKWRRLNWYGLRSWLYLQGLHAAVHTKKPWTCQAVPPKGMGGYSHWHCRLPRKHDGMHRFNNYTWGEVGGERIGTSYEPEQAS